MHLGIGNHADRQHLLGGNVLAAALNTMHGVFLSHVTNENVGGPIMWLLNGTGLGEVAQLGLGPGHPPLALSHPNADPRHPTPPSGSPMWVGTLTALRPQSW